MQIRVRRDVGIIALKRDVKAGEVIDIDTKFAKTLINNHVADPVVPNEDKELKKAVAKTLGVPPENVTFEEESE